MTWFRDEFLDDKHTKKSKGMPAQAQEHGFPVGRGGKVLKVLECPGALGGWECSVS